MRSTRQGTAGSAGTMPPGGDNVTTPQILDTMRALQAEVAASQADNAELRRASEELCRDLQHVGEHATDEHAPPVPFRARPMSFSRAIMNAALPTTSLGPMVSFTGVEDPKAHLTAFHTQMMLTGGSDAVYCKMLMCQARRWNGLLASPTDTSPTLTSLQRCSRSNTLSTRPPPPLDFLMTFSMSNSIRGSP